MSFFKFSQSRIKPEFWESYELEYKNEEDFLRCVSKGIWLRAKEQELSTLPEGYYWQEDSGGSRFSNQPPTYRLWNNKLGYMFHSE